MSKSTLKYIEPSPPFRCKFVFLAIIPHTVYIESYHWLYHTTCMVIVCLPNVQTNEYANVHKTNALNKCNRLTVHSKRKIQIFRNVWNYCSTVNVQCLNYYLQSCRTVMRPSCLLFYELKDKQKLTHTIYPSTLGSDTHKILVLLITLHVFDKYTLYIVSDTKTKRSTCNYVGVCLMLVNKTRYLIKRVWALLLKMWCKKRKWKWKWKKKSVFIVTYAGKTCSHFIL